MHGKWGYQLRVKNLEKFDTKPEHVSALEISLCHAAD
jgi:hypothetical protein